VDRDSRDRTDDFVVTNDFVVKVATVNGTGSASANGMLMQAIFRMGIPVSGKNVFPSNIQGLPTWYEIRVNKDGHLARSQNVDLMVAINPKTYEQDINEVRPGGAVIFDSSWPLDKELLRADVMFFGVPLSHMCVENFKGARERILMKNIAYVGAVAGLLAIDLEVIEGMLEEKFSAKQHLMDSNNVAIRLGYDYAMEHFDGLLRIRLEAMDANRDSVLMTGNMAAALGCVYAGATVGAWYPITPATSLMDSFRGFCASLRKDPETGKNLYCIIQAEDELAAIGMVLGAGWMGARAFTPTSGAGLSLMNEFLGMAYYAEIPAVIFDVQRAGPSTGMPTRTQQGDFFTAAFASHGDTKHILLFPGDPRECFYFSVEAFDLAERFQTPVFVVSDLDIGMNDWVCEKLEWDDAYVPDRGKVLSAEDLQELEVFHRYLDSDGDGIPARTLPGVDPKGAYFTRGSGHDRFGRYTEDADLYRDVVDRIARKIEGAAEALPAPEVRITDEATVGLVTVGGCRPAVLEALELLEEEGIHLDFLRVTGFPFSAAVEEFLLDHDVNIVVEQNRDAQLKRLLMLETAVPKKKLASVLDYGGAPLSAEVVAQGVRARLGLVPVEAG
jgi:2-oxoglutarate ferredoxin oxidoreductase subunit alpha